MEQTKVKINAIKDREFQSFLKKSKSPLPTFEVGETEQGKGCHLANFELNGEDPNPVNQLRLGCSSLVEHLASMQTLWVPSPAPEQKKKHKH